MTIERSNRNSKSQGVLRTALVAAVAAVVCLISPVLASSDPARCEPSSEALAAIKPLGKPEALPAMTFKRKDGTDLALADLAGRGVVLNFWATWCAPCVREMPELDALNRDLKDKGIDVLAVSLDRGGHNAIEKFYTRTKIAHLEALLDPKGAESRKADIVGLPTTLIIDGQGREVARIVGIHKYDTAETRAYLERCIGGE